MIVQFGAMTQETLPLKVSACLVGATVVASVSAALGLSLRDHLYHRLREGQRLNPILRLYFAFGLLSLVLWIAFVMGLTAIIVTLSV